MRAATGFLLLAVLVLAPVTGALAAPDEEMDAIEREIAELKAIVETLTARLDALLERVRSLREGDQPAPSGAEGTYRLHTPSQIDSILARRLEEEAEELAKLDEEERARRVAELRAEVEESMVGFSLTVTLLPEGRFEATAEFGGESQTASGTWKLEEERITLVTTFENGEEQEDPEEISGTVRDGVLCLYDEDGTSFVLKK